MLPAPRGLTKVTIRRAVLFSCSKTLRHSDRVTNRCGKDAFAALLMLNSQTPQPSSQRDTPLDIVCRLYTDFIVGFMYVSSSNYLTPEGRVCKAYSYLIDLAPHI